MNQSDLVALIAKHTPPPKKKTESNDLLPRLIKKASELGSRLWRNNVGTLMDRYGHRVTYGLCIGSSDLIGYTVRVVTPEMVGSKIAVFTAIEAKAARGVATDRQVEFVRSVNVDGGIAQIVRSPEELHFVLKPQ